MQRRIIFMSMIKIENLTFSYPTSYDNVFENVSFQVDTDWKLGFVGRNGRGKTTFLNLLLGKYEYSGKILSSVQFDYFPYPVSDKNRITEDILQEICPLAEECANVKKKVGQCLKKTRPPTLEKKWTTRAVGARVALDQFWLHFIRIFLDCSQMSCSVHS